MCTAALKRELNLRIDGLSDESVRLIIELIDSLKLPAGSSQDTRRSNEDLPSHRGAVDPSILGALKGSLIYMADDFDETPECFKEYV